MDSYNVSLACSGNINQKGVNMTTSRHIILLFSIFVADLYLISSQSQCAESIQSGEHAALEQRQIVARQFQRNEIL